LPPFLQVDIHFSQGGGVFSYTSLETPYWPLHGIPTNQSYVNIIASYPSSRLKVSRPAIFADALGLITHFLLAGDARVSRRVYRAEGR